MVPLKLVIMEKYLAILSRHSAFTPRIPYGQCRQPVFSLEEKQPPGYRWLQHADLMLQVVTPTY